uniref:Putative secreted protein n=1 Tax=Anopheles darlingi TaxID=43151 RepID=A0A2M4D959_ANODA
MLGSSSSSSSAAFVYFAYQLFSLTLAAHARINSPMCYYATIPPRSRFTARLTFFLPLRPPFYRPLSASTSSTIRAFPIFAPFLFSLRAFL